MRKLRVLIGILGMDQHEVGALSVAKMLSDAGLEVIYAGRFNTPATLVQSALQEAADVIGISCHSWEYIQFTPDLMDLIKKEETAIAVVVGGSVITPTDANELLNQGVAAVLGPGTAREEIIAAIEKIGSQRR